MAFVAVLHGQTYAPIAQQSLLCPMACTTSKTSENNPQTAARRRQRTPNRGSVQRNDTERDTSHTTAMLTSALCEVVRSVEEDVQWLSDRRLKVQSRPGSIWGTPEWRRSIGWLEPSTANLLLWPMSEAPAVFALMVDATPAEYGAQAGLLLYTDDNSYVKFVHEGDKIVGSSMLVLAQQVDGSPAVTGKVKFDAGATPVLLLLRLSVCNGLVLAQYRYGNTDWLGLSDQQQTVMPQGARAGIMTSGLHTNPWVTFTAVSESYDFLI